MTTPEREEFEKWAEDCDARPLRVGANDYIGICGYFWKAWQDRQPEIDALNDEVELISIARKSQNAAYEQEIDALKAEVEILRKDADRWQCVQQQYVTITKFYDDRTERWPMLTGIGLTVEVDNLIAAMTDKGE